MSDDLSAGKEKVMKQKHTEEIKETIREDSQQAERDKKKKKARYGTTAFSFLLNQLAEGKQKPSQKLTSQSMSTLLNNTEHPNLGTMPRNNRSNTIKADFNFQGKTLVRGSFHSFANHL